MFKKPAEAKAFPFQLAALAMTHRVLAVSCRVTRRKPGHLLRGHGRGCRNLNRHAAA